MFEVFALLLLRYKKIILRVFLTLSLVLLGSCASLDSHELPQAYVDLKPVDSIISSNYDPRDVRAKIIVEEKIYYVGRKGSVREGKNYFELDKISFKKQLKNLAKNKGCKKRT